MNSKRLHTIKSVAEITGLSVFVIRAWENRYRAVEPTRTESNRRLYSEEDINKLILLSKATNKGYSIGNIANLSIKELKNITGEHSLSDLIPDSGSSLSHPQATDFLDQCLEAIQEINTTKFDSLLLKASVELSHQILLDRLIVPLIEIVGDMWKEGSMRIASEHLFSSSLSTFLANLAKSYRVPENSPKILISTPTGQQHELGALLAACIAAASGWKVVYLGPNLPVEEIASAAGKLEVKAVTLSIVYPEDDMQLIEDLKRLKSMIPDIPLLFGGRAVVSYQKVLKTINARIGYNLNDFRNHLDEIRKPLTN